MITMDASQIRRFEHTLERLNSRGLVFAEIEAVNRASFETQKNAKAKLGQRMTLRNSWTERSIQVQRAHRGRLEASVGSTQSYMEKQQNGHTETATGEHGVAIPTASASGEGRATQRKRLVRKPNRMVNIALNRKPNAITNRKSRNAAAIRQAAAGGGRYVFLDLQRTKGIFRVTGGKRRPKIEMMHDLSRKSIRINKNPWLTDAAAAPTRDLPRYYGEALRRQLARVRY